MEAARQSRRSTSRTRRSHASFSDLRLAPLTTPAPKQVFESLKSPRTPEDSSIAHAYRTNHSSYLSGRSAPSTPGILSRSPSRHRQYAGLSRKNHDETDNPENVEPGYFGYKDVEDANNNDTRPIGDRPKAKSEIGLNMTGKNKARLRRLKTQDMGGRSVSSSAGPMTPSLARPKTANDGDWLMHVTSFTTNLLAEGKGSTWVSSHSSVSNLHSYASQAHLPISGYHSDSDADDTTPRANDHSLRLSIPPASEPLDPPRSAGWGSRFGSRTASRAPSRRNSHGHLSRPLTLTAPADSGSAAYRFGTRPTSSHSAIPSSGPDFVDPAVAAEFAASLASVARDQQSGWGGAGPRDDPPEPGSDADDDEAEVARLARTPGFGLTGGFGVLDRLVGLGNFALDEDETERERDEEALRPRKARPALAWRRRSQAPIATAVQEDDGEQVGGWRDAAWLLSVATKVLF